jgi:hypothetical protein
VSEATALERTGTGMEDVQRKAHNLKARTWRKEIRTSYRRDSFSSSRFLLRISELVFIFPSSAMSDLTPLERSGIRTEDVRRKAQDLKAKMWRKGNPDLLLKEVPLLVALPASIFRACFLFPLQCYE